jgi:hypothetical protein
MFSNLFSEVDIIIVVNMVVCLAIGFVIERIMYLKREIKDMHIRLSAHQREEEMRYQVLINQIKQQNKPSAIDDLQLLFADKTKNIKRQYPALTDTDIQVLTLIGLGVGNADILQFTDMSKRTYYKRRQLIAQRMNTTAAQLDELAKQLFTSK